MKLRDLTTRHMDTKEENGEFFIISCVRRIN